MKRTFKIVRIRTETIFKDRMTFEEAAEQMRICQENEPDCRFLFEEVKE